MFDPIDHWQYWVMFFAIGWGMVLVNKKGWRFFFIGVFLMMLGNLMNRQLLVEHREVITDRYQSLITEHYIERCISANALVNLNGDWVWVDKKVQEVFGGNNITLEEALDGSE
jgi:hypothetical protein